MSSPNDEDTPFHIGGIVEKNTSKPQSLPGTTKSSASSLLKPMTKNSTPGASFPKPMPNKRYTTREDTASTNSSSSIGGFSQKPINGNSSSSNRNNNNNNQSGPSLSSAPPKNERLIETSEFLQILRETMSKSSSSSSSSIKLDAGSQEKLAENSNSKEEENSLSTAEGTSSSMDTILRVARSSVPAQRAAALRTLQARCEKFDSSSSNQQRFSDHGFFINAPLEVASSLFHAEEAGPRLAMLAHLAYEDANQTVREAALLLLLTMLI